MVNTILSPSNQPTAHKTFFCRGGWLLGLCALIVTVSGCLSVSAPSVPPPQSKIENSILLDASVKEVWESVSRVAAEHSLSLGRVHTDAGLITFDILDIDPRIVRDYVDCGLIRAKEWQGNRQVFTYESWVDKAVQRLDTRITLSVISEGRRKSRLTVGVRYTLRTAARFGEVWIHWFETNQYSPHSFYYEVTCTPTHRLEKTFIDTVKENLQKQRSAKK